MEKEIECKIYHKFAVVLQTRDLKHFKTDIINHVVNTKTFHSAKKEKALVTVHNVTIK